MRLWSICQLVYVQQRIAGIFRSFLRSSSYHDIVHEIYVKIGKLEWMAQGQLFGAMSSETPVDSMRYLGSYQRIHVVTGALESFAAKEFLHALDGHDANPVGIGSMRLVKYRAGNGLTGRYIGDQAHLDVPFCFGYCNSDCNRSPLLVTMRCAGLLGERYIVSLWLVGFR